jgi:predicted nucleic acid-binding protein
MSRRALLVLDANVLIDYVHAARSILRLTVQHLGDVVVPEAILDEVEDLSREDCEALGIEVVTATDDQVTEAAAFGRKGPLSFNDRLFVLMARDARWICVTNDRSLRAACEREELEVRWSLRIMLDLVTMEVLEANEAERIARAIAEENPFITANVISDFCRKLTR